MGGMQDLDDVDFYDAELNRCIQRRDWQNVAKITGRSESECARRYARGLCAPLSSTPKPEDAINWAVMLTERIQSLKAKSPRLSRRLIAQCAGCSPSAIAGISEGYYIGTLAVRQRIDVVLVALEAGEEIVDTGTHTAPIRAAILAAGWTVPAMAKHLGVHRTTLYLSNISEELKGRIEVALTERRAA